MRCRWSGASLVVDAPAKLNFRLEVLGKRPDGFHELETVMASVGLFDTLRISPAADLNLECVPESDELGPPEKNLVFRAARALQAEAGINTGARLTLIKRIPMQAGMGGGSSDASAALVGLNRFWGLNLPSSTLHRLAAGLGSDLNFFLDSDVMAMCRGRGENIESLPLRTPIWFALGKPPVGLSTPAVFRQLRLNQLVAGDSGPLMESASTGNVGALGTQLRNDLQTPSEELSPELRTTLARLSAIPSHGAAMTGSGSVCFALCGNRKQAQRVAKRLSRQCPTKVEVVRSTS